MTSKYQPRFPLTVSGENYRRPFRNADIERVAREMDRIYSDIDLYKDDRARMLEMYSPLGPAQLQREAKDTKSAMAGWGVLKAVEADLIAFCARLDIDLNTEGWDDI